MSGYFRPLVQTGLQRPPHAVSLAGGRCWFTHAEHVDRSGSQFCAVSDIPSPQLARLTAPRAAVAGQEMTQPVLMGILNVTPDSFSDGGKFLDPALACAQGLKMLADGVAILDIGGESTRPGAAHVAETEEIDRTVPVISALRAQSDVPISIDTRKRSVAKAAIDAGANLVNDVSGFTFDTNLAPYCAAQNLPICVMHAQGDPATMQDEPHYENVVLDVYDFLDAQVKLLEKQGIARRSIVVDPGIGFGKTLDHNLTLLRNISLFHGLGCPILLGASRKRFIGTLGNAPLADHRAPGSIAVGLAALAQGVQILRVHDVAETAQAVRLWCAVQ